jgi:glycosyltransferase involved in cell wall biosynthesis
MGDIGRAPVSVCLIVKNEEKQLRRCLSALRPHVAEIVVVDTGSSDTTPDIARELADVFETFLDCNGPDGKITSFALARQRSFDLATQPWVMWVDGDDDVAGAELIGQVVARADAERDGQPAIIMLPYEYAHDEQGNVTCLHLRERLMTPRESVHWTGPVHEVVVPRPGFSHRMIHSESVKMVHRRVQSGKAVEDGRNLRILKAHYEKVGESDVRQLYYLGLEYGNVGDVGNAIRFHKRYVELSGWDDERFMACMKIAEHYQAIGDYDTAVEWGLQGLIVREGWSEAYFSLARSFYFMGHRGGPQARRNWERCVHFARLGLQIPPTKTILFVNPLERSFEIHNYLNFALNALGDVAGALESVNLALSVRPNDGNLLVNKSIYEKEISRRKFDQAVQEMRASGCIGVDDEVVFRGKDSPSVPPVLPIVTPAPVPAASGSGPGLDIALYVGPGPEPWNPDTIRRNGIGGSELMAMHMAKRMAALGHRVRLFGDTVPGSWDGVEWLHHESFRDVMCDVLLTSRRASAVDDDHGCKARATVAWVHDVHMGSALTHTRALRIDRFLCLSEWHKDFFLGQYGFLHPDQILVTRNGIDLSRFDNPPGPGHVVRNPRRAIYSSSPDRGLEVLLRAWPMVRTHVPDAELHVFYGFHTWKATARHNDDSGQLKLIDHIESLIEQSNGRGVFFHDRVDQDRLAREFLASGVWTYPTWFSETSCLTAMEAQAAGLRIVTSPIAALNETVGDRGVMIPGDWLSPEYMKSFVRATVAAMRSDDPAFREAQAAQARERFSLDALAKDWDLMLRRTVAEVERDVVPPYRSFRR